MIRQQLPLLEEVGDPQARRADDFYETQVWQIEALLRRIYIHPAMRIVEPCAGNGAISKRLLGRGFAVWSNDVVQRDFPLDSTLDASTGSLWTVVRPVDIVITNVPFTLALPIVSRAVLEARLLVATLLRSTWDEPTEDRTDWLVAHPPTAQIAMPRAGYRGTAGRDSATHHWFIWAKCMSFHHDTVTQAERDALIAAERRCHFHEGR